LSFAAWQTSPWAAASAEPQQRRHRALADRHGFLHGAATGFQQPRGIAQAEGTGGGQRRIFAQRMAGHVTDLAVEAEPALGSQRVHHRHGDRHQGRLGIFGQAQFVIRPFEHQFREVLAQRVVDLFEDLARGCKGVGQGLAHANFLRPLAGEYECHAHGG
jgi:hypothetical protein